MSVQRQRSTRTRRDRKRKRFNIQPKKMQTCPKCAKPVLPHQACQHCGYYKGREVINTLKKSKSKKPKSK